MSSTERSVPVGHLLLLGALLLLGLCYVASFAWLARNSTDFVARDLDARAQAVAAMPTLAAGESFAFDVGSPGVGLLGTGWKLPDREGSWTESGGGTFFLPGNLAGRRVELDFVVHFVGDDEPLRVVLSANNDHVADWQPTARNHEVRASVLVPQTATAEQYVRLQFRIQRPPPSFWPRTPPGARAYGLKFRQLRLVADPPPGAA